MRVRERRATLTQAELDAVLRPRAVTVEETALDATTFGAHGGPVRDYRRTVSYEPTADGRFRVVQRVEFATSEEIGVWRLYLAPLLAAHLGRIGPNDKPPFWFPPDQIDARAIAALSRIATLTFVLGYTSILLTQTITYAADEFGANKSAQGFALATARVDVLIALPLAFLADRRGRRWLAVNGTVAACGLSALAALAPNLIGLTAAQVLARGVTSACIVTSAVMLAEEMPKSARAWATGLAAMAGGVGSGACVLALPLADLATWSWRILYVVPIAFIPLARRVGSKLEETRRYVVHAANRVTAATSLASVRAHRARFALIAVSGLLINVFAVPAAQFQNEFLRDERGFSGTQIALFITLTSLPGAIGIIVGGRLAEGGRRLVGAAATFLGVGFTVLQYYSHGALIYVWSTFGSIFGSAVVPALGVYGAELFPTETRGAAQGGVGLVARVGSVAGLIVAGQLGDRIGLSHAIAYLSIGPAVLTVLILAAYPETAHRELEDLNPEDEPVV